MVACTGTIHRAPTKKKLATSVTMYVGHVGHVAKREERVCVLHITWRMRVEQALSEGLSFLHRSGTDIYENVFRLLQFGSVRGYIVHSVVVPLRVDSAQR